VAKSISTKKTNQTKEKQIKNIRTLSSIKTALGKGFTVHGHKG